MSRSRTRSSLLAALVAGTLVLGLAAPGLADEKDSLNRKREGVSAKIDDAQKSYDQSSKAYAKATASLARARARLASARTTLGGTRGQLAVAAAEDRRMQAELEASEAALDAAVAKLERGQKKLERSEVQVEQFTVESLQQGDGGLKAFSELLRGESPSAFSEKVTLNESVSDAQLATMQRLAASKVMLRLNRDKVEALRDEVEEAREVAAANLVRKQELEAAAEQQAATVASLVSARGRASTAANRVKQEDAKLLAIYEAERNALNARLAALAAKDRKDGGKSHGGDGGGALSYPVSSSVTSPYGMRVHPITGVYKLHDGTDFVAGCGTPIRAAAGGTIIEQYYNAGYGNRVILANGVKRGKSIVTTYNHLTSFAKGAGAKVKRGEVIGYAGTTGMSTGCHLHFMVLADGSPTDPMNWL